MGVVFTFPGQGAQHPGMITALPASAAVHRTLDEAADRLGHAVELLEQKAALGDTRNVQLALTIAGVAAARHLIEAGAPPDAVMGLSIGAWPAAVAAGALDFAAALELVSTRGRLMGEAYPRGYGMTAVIGLDEAAVRRLVHACSQNGEPLYIANVNCERQIVVAGSEAGLARLGEAVKQGGAARIRRLDMAVPSHCPLLEKPAERLAALADPAWFRAPRLAYFSANARKRLWRAEAVREDLVYNMARTVYWAASARIVHESGFELAVEMPPGHVLTGLHPAMEPPGEAVAVDEVGWRNAAALVRRSARSRRPAP